MSGAHVAIIVLNYNGWENTRDCLESVMALEYAGLSLFVVDNGSRDGEAGKIDPLAFRGVRVAGGDGRRWA